MHPCILRQILQNPIDTLEHFCWLSLDFQAYRSTQQQYEHTTTTIYSLNDDIYNDVSKIALVINLPRKATLKQLYTTEKVTHFRKMLHKSFSVGPVKKW